MNEILCPHCNKAFKVDEAGYADILKQVRNHEFEQELLERVHMLEREKDNAVKLAEARTKNELQADTAKKDAEIAELKAQKDLALAKLESLKDAEISEMRARLQSIEAEKKLAVSEAVHIVEKQRDELANELKNKDTEKQLLETSLKERFAAELKTKDDIIKLKDEEITLRKDMKAKLSTKMVGETLEQHCETEFNKLRATAFKHAYFEKDNDTKSGSKGDYIYREIDELGNEIISIMFEMKNEGDDKEYDTSNWVIRKFLKGAYVNVPGAVIGSATVGSTKVTTITYTVTDGGELDDDGLVNGVIVDPAGPAVLAVTSPDTGIQSANTMIVFGPAAIGVGLLIAGLQKRRSQHDA